MCSVWTRRKKNKARNKKVRGGDCKYSSPQTEGRGAPWAEKAAH